MKPVVALITSNDRERTLPSVVELEAGESGMTEESWIQCHELFTAPDGCLEVEPVGVLSAEKLIEVEHRLAYVCDLRKRGTRQRDRRRTVRRDP